jgi:hypothetical protein
MPRNNVTLIAAVKKGDRDAVGRLLRQGADLQMRDGNGLTPLMWAARKGHLVLAEMLLDSGADPNACDSYGRTALHYAVAGHHPAVVKILAERKANLDAKDNEDCTPFEIAAMAENDLMGKALLILGAQGSPPDPGVISLEHEDEAPVYWPVDEAIDLLSLRLSDLPEHNPWGEKGRLHVIFHTPGSKAKADGAAVRRVSFSEKKRLMIVKAEVPKSLTKKRPVDFLLESLRQAILLAERAFKRIRIPFPADAIREHLDAIGVMKNWEFPDFHESGLGDKNYE